MLAAGRWPGGGRDEGVSPDRVGALGDLMVAVSLGLALGRALAGRNVEAKQRVKHEHDNAASKQVSVCPWVGPRNRTGVGLGSGDPRAEL